MPRHSSPARRPRSPDLQRQIGITEDQLSVLLGRNPDAILRTQSSEIKR